MSTTSREDRGSDPFQRLVGLPRDTPCALLHDCGYGVGDGAESGSRAARGWSEHWLPGGGAQLFASPVDVLQVSAAERFSGLDQIDRFLRMHRGRPVVGFLGYDLRDAIEAIPRRIEEDFPIPVVHLQAHERVEVFAGASVPDATISSAIPSRALRPRIAADAYQDLVARTVEHIRAGDIFQANLTQPFDADLGTGPDADPRALFRQLCAVSPAPFAAYVEAQDGLAVLSSSPEEFLCRDGSEVRSRPIKGTRPRRGDPDSDRAMLDELIHSEKDLAELAMIVDLLRNDLGKVAEIGSVGWGRFPEHASFAQVHHLFCAVTARLRSGVTTGELLRATFPCGSITGAPKLRCMEILEELEVVRRGVYTGAIGRFGPGDHMQLNVAIRTMTVRDRRVRLNVGGAVTADSDPVAEWEETIDKARGMRRALGAAEVGPG